MKAHVGVTDNKASGMFAKSDTELDDIGVHIQLLPHSVNNRIIQETLEIWQRQKKQTSDGCVLIYFLKFM